MLHEYDDIMWINLDLWKLNLKGDLDLWCRKNHQWATQSSHTRNNTCTIKREDLTESTSVVLAKYPPKVKLELFKTLECQSWDELCVPVF